MKKGVYFSYKLTGFWLAGGLLAMLSLIGKATPEIADQHSPGLAMTPAIKKSRATQLRAHVEALATGIGERNMFTPNSLARAAEYIRHQWETQGYEVAAYPYIVRGQEVENLEVALKGTEFPEEVILVGAHYDTVPGSPGANDNASGVAALLELSHKLAGKELPRSLRFVAFVNEEPPFFKTPKMGSRVYARMARERGKRLKGVVVLETIGYYRNEPDTQKYPPLFGLFYPDRGNFVGFVSNLRSRGLLHRAVGSFRKHSNFPLEYLSAPALIPGVDWSDHSSFWRYGYDAIMVTDTALYRYPYYHSFQDTPDKLDYDSLVQLTVGLYGMLLELASADL
ncbi:peptidase M28 [Nitrosococcus halophilus Nc 4]|uniref:Peptidase M28 n=2 Tax=Nitrosococcus halophilus TaxID=133539 RepID=D5C4X5_NITHN|nr:peptidase M28 [Nitrosococcus halophilus Nc 4]